MAKTATKKNAKPSQPAALDPAAMAQQTAAPLPSDPTVEPLLTVEVGGAPSVHPGYCTRHLNAQMSPRQAAAAKFLATMLSAQGVRVGSGRASVDPAGATVETSNDAVRCLLEQFADRLEEATGKKLVNDFELKFR